MGAFFCRRDAQGIERWWLEVSGNGNKTRLVPATRPLRLTVIGRNRRDKDLSRGALHLILKEVFGMAADRLRAGGPEWAGAGRCPGQRLGPLAAPHRRLAHDRPAG